jgi:MYXO-CTERM domain-containing protein
MRFAGVLGVLLFAAAPVLAAPISYTFNSTSGSITLDLEGQGSTTSGLAGTFSVDIDDGTHVAASDTALLTGADLETTSAMKLVIAGLASANVGPASAKILDFLQPNAAHIEANGSAVCMTDALLEATVVVTGAFKTTFETSTTAGTLLPVTVTFNQSAAGSQTLTANLSFVFGYVVGISDIGLTITLDLIMNVEGTAHVVPDPALGGLTALGLGGAGAWLRRRSLG